MDASFQKRTLFVIAVALLALALIVFFWSVRRPLLIAFAAFLVAVFLNACAHFVQRLTRLPYGWALALAVPLLTGVGALLLWLMLPPFVTQFGSFVTGLPELLSQAETTLERSVWGRELLSRLSSFYVPPEEAGPLVGNTLLQAREALSITISTATDVLLMLVTGLFVAADPGLYRRGLLLLVPKPRRQQASDLLGESVATVRAWLLGQFVAMSFVGVVCWLGLMIIGVPQALILGLLAGLLDFIPFLGPFLAFFPAAVVGLSLGLTPFLWVALLYLVVQQLESNLIQPLVQKRAVSIPPAMLMLALVIMGQLFGLLGLLVATPLTALLILLIKRVYVERILGTPLPD